MKKRYRIKPVMGGWSTFDYGIECWRPWFPFWIRVGITKTFSDIETAEHWLDQRLKPKDYQPKKSI
jgi:hypothetical protein